MSVAERIWRSICFAFSIALAFASLMLEVSPQDAATNFCKWANTVWPTCAQALPHGAIPRWTSWIGWLLFAALLFWVFWPWLKRIRIHILDESRRNTGVDALARLDINQQPGLQILIGHDAPYVEAYVRKDNVTKTVFAIVKNTGNVLLSNCRVYCESPTIKDRWLRVDTFSLSAGGNHRIGIASYSEPVSPEMPASNSIQLHAPAGTGYGGFFPTVPSSGGIVTIIAVCDDCAERRESLKLWVKDKKLCWEKV